MLTKNITTFVCLAFLFAGINSCKKDKNTETPIGTISVSINGTSTTFNYSAKATRLAVSGGYGIEIKGYKKDPASSATNLKFSVVRSSAISAGSYTENTIGNPLVTMDYFYDLLFGTGYTFSTFKSSTNPMTVNITEITSSYVKGTFSGEVQGVGITGANEKNVMSNGTFYVSF